VETAVPQNSKAFLARYNLGVACSSASQPVAAIEQFRIAKRLMDEQNVKHGAIHSSLGWAYLQAGDYPNAVQELRLARAPNVFAKLSEITKRQVDHNLALAESYLNVRPLARAAR
jgi:tetratricopeptide (TPR) repeat protein